MLALMCFSSCGRHWASSSSALRKRGSLQGPAPVALGWTDCFPWRKSCRGMPEMSFFQTLSFMPLVPPIASSWGLFSLWGGSIVFMLCTDTHKHTRLWSGWWSGCFLRGTLSISWWDFLYSRWALGQDLRQMWRHRSAVSADRWELHGIGEHFCRSKQTQRADKKFTVTTCSQQSLRLELRSRLMVF